MKKLLGPLLFLFLLISSVAFAEPVQENNENITSKIESILNGADSLGNVQNKNVAPGNIFIPANTKFEVVLADSVSSKTHKQDQIIYFKTVSNFIVNNVVVIPKDTMGKAIIVEATKPGGFGRKGTLTFEARSIPTINNVEVPLSATIKGQGKSDEGAIAVAVAVSLIGGIFMKGTNISYPAGTPFTVTVVRDTDLNTTAENLASAMDLSKPQGNSIQVTAKQL